MSGAGPVAKGARVLLAESEPVARRFVAALLRQQGYEVEEAADGEAVLRAARERRPDLIVLEMVLPGRDGTEILEALGKGAETRRTPVLVLSVRSREEDVVRGLELGAEDYMTKPFHTQELILRVRKILARAT